MVSLTVSCDCRILYGPEHEPLFLRGVLIDVTVDQQREDELEYHRRRLEALVAKRAGQVEKQTELLRAANSNLVHEIEQRREAQAQLQESETRFRLLLESAGEGIYGLNREGCCTFVNEAALAMLGYSRNELQGREIHSLIHHTHADGTPCPAEACPIYDALRTGRPTSHGLVELLWRKGGTSFSAEYSAHPVRDDGRVIGAVTTTAYGKAGAAEVSLRLINLPEEDKLGNECAAGVTPWCYIRREAFL